MLRVVSRRRKCGIGDLRLPFWPAGARDVRNSCGGMWIGRIACLELLGKPLLRRIGVRNRHAPAGSVLHQVDDAPVRDGRNGQACDSLERDAIVKRLGELLARVGQEPMGRFGAPQIVNELGLYDDAGRAADRRPKQEFVFLGELERRQRADVSDANHLVVAHHRHAVHRVHPFRANDFALHVRVARGILEEDRLSLGRDMSGEPFGNRHRKIALEVFFQADRGARAKRIALAKEDDRGIDRFSALERRAEQAPEEGLHVTRAERCLRDAIDGLQQFVPRGGIPRHRLPNGLIERDIQVSKLAQIDGRSDARLPEIEDGPAQQAVLGHDLIEVEPASEPIDRVILGKAAERCRLAGMNRLDDRGDPRQDLRQVIDDRGVGQVARGRQRAHACLPVADDLLLPVSEEFP